MGLLGPDTGVLPGRISAPTQRIAIGIGKAKGVPRALWRGTGDVLRGVKEKQAVGIGRPLKPGEKIDENKLVGEVLLPSEGAVTPEQKLAGEMLGSEKSSWRGALGKAGKENQTEGNKTAVREVRQQVDGWGTQVNDDGEIERSRLDEARHTDATYKLKQIEQVLDGTYVMHVGDVVYIQVSQAIDQMGGPMADQLRSAANDHDREVMISKLLKRPEFQSSVREILQQLKDRQSPAKLQESQAKIDQADETIVASQSETKIKSTQLERAKKKLTDYEPAGKTGTDGKKYTELKQLQTTVEKLDTDLETTRSQFEQLKMEQQIAFKNQDMTNYQRITQELSQAQMKYVATEARYNNAKARLDKLEDAKRGLEQTRDEAQDALKRQQQEQAKAKTAKAKAEKKLAKEQGKQVTHETELVDALKNALSEAVPLYESKMEQAFGDRIDTALKTAQERQTTERKKAVYAALAQRYDERIKRVDRRGNVIGFERRPRQDTINSDFAELMTQDNPDEGADALLRHILQTTPELMMADPSHPGEQIPNDAEINALLSDAEFVNQTKQTAVELVILKRERTVGITGDQRVEIANASWGRELFTSNNPEVKKMLTEAGVTADPTAPEFQEQLEEAVTNREKVQDPHNPDKLVEKGSQLLEMIMMLGLFGGVAVTSTAAQEQGATPA